MTRNQYFMILWVLCVISAFAVIPFTETVSLLTGGKPPLEFYVSLFGSMLITLVVIAAEALSLYGLAIFFGMKFAEKLGIRFLFLERDVNFKDNLFKSGLFSGISCAFAILLVDKLMPASSLSLNKLAMSTPPLYGLAAALLGGINQDVVLCLICISGIALVLKFLFKPENITVIMVMSILISALIFGLLHIPTFVQQMTMKHSLVIARILILNLISGSTFGILFWRKSFETAVLSHMIVDLIIYFLMPVFGLLY